MPRRTPKRIINKIQKLYSKGTLSISKIAEKVGVSYSTAYAHTTLEEKGYSSYYDYNKAQLEKRGIPSFSAYQKSLSSKKGSKFYIEPQELIGNTNTPLYEYRKRQIEKKGMSMHEYNENKVKALGYGSLQEYYNSMAKKRQKQTLNKIVSKLVKERLEALDRYQRDFASELGISAPAFSRIANGKTLPRKELQEKFFRVLELPYKTLDELLK